MYRNTIVYSQYIFSVHRNKSRFKCISKSWSTSVRQRANYTIISKSSHWNVFYKKGVLEIWRKILQKYLWLSSYFVNELWAWLLLNFCLFLTAQKKQAMVSPLFRTWNSSLQINQLFFEKMLHVNELQLKKVSLKVPDIFVEYST